MIRRLRALISAAAIAVLFVGCAANETASVSTTTVTVDRTVTVTASPAVESSTSPPAPALKATFRDGTYVVGKDVAAGSYSTPGGKDGMCAFTFLPYKGAPLTEAAGGQTVVGQGYMTLEEGQIVQTIGCTWTLE